MFSWSLLGRTGQTKVMKFVRPMAKRLGIRIERDSIQASDSLLGLKEMDARTVLDVGANRGTFAKQARGLFPQATIHCFEPIPEMLKELQNYKEGTSDKQLMIWPFAAGKEDDCVQMYLHSDHPASSSILPTTEKCESQFPQVKIQEPIDIQVRAIDDVLEKQDLSRPLLIKLDVQGYEASALEGAKRILDLVDAAIVEVSLDNLYLGQPSFFELLMIFRKHGLHYAGNLHQVLAEDGHVVFFDAVFRRE